MAQTLNIRGFVAGIEIEPDEYLLPLQEAIVNSIQSIEDKTPNEGRNFNQNNKRKTTSNQRRF